MPTTMYLLVVAQYGSVLAFCEERWRSPCDDTGECHIVVKQSRDHGQTWGDLIHLRRKASAKYHMGSAVVDQSAEKVLLMCGGGYLQSADNGDTWQDWWPVIHTAEGTSGGSTHGRTIHSSNYFLQGTGEACLVERINGDLYFNARAYFGDHQRKTAISHDGGCNFIETVAAESLQEVGQGCNASIVRYPAELCNGCDILLFVNPDTKGPHREHGVVHVSEDGMLSFF